MNKWVSEWVVSEDTSEKILLKYPTGGLAEFCQYLPPPQLQLFTAQNLEVPEFYFHVSYSLLGSQDKEQV